MKYAAEIKMAMPPKTAQIIRGMLNEEQRSGERSEASMTYDNGSLVMSLTSSDPVAMRAAVNSHMRWIRIVLDMERLKEGC